jgi:hypothetical protein
MQKIFARYYLKTWKDKVGQYGAVVDRKTGRWLLVSNTIRDGALWRDILKIQAARLNRLA